MKIGIVVNSAPPFPVAGAERQALDMARHLAERHDVVVFARRFGGAPVVERFDRFTLVRCPFLNLGPLRFPSQSLTFRWLFARHGRGCDVVLSYQTFIPGHLAAQAKERHRVPFILWIRSQDEIQYSTRKKFGWAGRFVLPRADHVLVQSERMRLEFLREAGRAYGDTLARKLSPLTTIGTNAVELTAERPTTGRDLLFVGRLIELKDLSTLFRALRRLNVPPPVRIVGDGPMRRLWEIEAEGLPVTFVGRVEAQLIHEEYRRARLFVLMSREEGLPNVVLEALAAGVPVVSTPVAAVPDIITDGVNGFLYPFGDDAALASLIGDVMGSADLHARLAAGALDTARRYSWERVVPEVERVLEGVARGAGNGGGMPPAPAEPSQ